MPNESSPIKRSKLNRPNILCKDSSRIWEKVMFLRFNQMIIYLIYLYILVMGRVGGNFKQKNKRFKGKKSKPDQKIGGLVHKKIKKKHNRL